MTLRRLAPLLSVAFWVLALSPPATADVVFDFTGVCQSGDCEPGTEVAGELRFTDDAPLTHSDRLVTAEDFVSLTVDYFTPIHRVRVRSRWSPTTEATPVLPLEILIDPLGLLRELLLRDELKNRFQVEDPGDGGSWMYRLVQPASNESPEVDLTLAGAAGAFGPRRSSVPETPTAFLLAAALAGLGLRSRRGEREARSS